MSPEAETLETRLKRARMRAWRRGMREMDLILGGFVDSCGTTLSESEMAALEALLERRDQQLYAWISERDESEPDAASADEKTLIFRIRANLSGETAKSY